MTFRAKPRAGECLPTETHVPKNAVPDVNSTNWAASCRYPLARRCSLCRADRKLPVKRTALN